jgi:peptidoglycan/xylan/chitin deacetylase (PgdA/CDA1 family)
MTILVIIFFLILIPVLYIPLPYIISKLLKKYTTDKYTGSDALYITFDDGPSEYLTPRILEMLEEANAKATFFLLGKHADQYPELVKIISDKGHLIGEHSYSHTHPWKSGPIKSAKDLLKGRKSLRQYQNHKRSIYFRPPYGKFNLITLLYVIFFRKKTIFWTDDPKDYMISTADHFIENEIQCIEKGAIVLLHDGRARTDENPDTTIDVLKAILEKSKRFIMPCRSVDDIY